RPDLVKGLADCPQNFGSKRRTVNELSSLHVLPVPSKRALGARNKAGRPIVVGTLSSRKPQYALELKVGTSPPGSVPNFLVMFITPRQSSWLSASLRFFAQTVLGI